MALGDRFVLSSRRVAHPLFSSSIRAFRKDSFSSLIETVPLLPTNLLAFTHVDALHLGMKGTAAEKERANSDST